MKKTNVPALISTAIMLFIFWLLLTGQIVAIFRGEASAEVLIAGVAVSLLVALFTSRFFIHNSAFWLFNPVRLLTFIFYSLVIFMWELLKANWDVARRALSPSLKVNPGIVKVPTELKEDYALSMLANSITLTPGTITMDIADQGGKTWYYIHWIDVKTQDPAAAGDEIKGTMEKWIRRIWE